MRRLLYILLLLPVFAWGQSQPVTMQFRRPDPQVNTLDSIYYTFPGKIGGYSFFWNAAKIRDYVAAHSGGAYNFASGLTNDGSGNISLGGTLTQDAFITGTYNILLGDITGASYIFMTPDSHTIAQHVNDPINGGSAHLGLSPHGVSLYSQTADGRTLSFTTDTTSGIVINDNVLHRGMKYGFRNYALLGDSSLTPKAYVDSVAIAHSGANPDSTLHPLKNLNDVPNKPTARLNLGVYSRSEIDTKVQLKQPRVISALPTQTLTRPLVSDSVNQAFAKLIFRGDSLASAIGTRLLKTDTAAMLSNVVHKAQNETITGIKTLTKNLLFAVDNTNIIGDATHAAARYYGYIFSSPGNLTVAAAGATGVIGFNTNGSQRALINASGIFSYTTAAPGTNTTELATTAFVLANAITNPMSTLGDIIYGGGSGVATRLAGNTATSRQFLTSTGNGTISAAPAYFNLFGTANTWSGVQTFTFGAVIGGGSPLNYNFGTFSTNFGSLTSTANRTINLPDASGTVALTSDISKYLRLTGSGTGATTTISFPHGQTGVTSASIAVVTPINAASSGISFVTCDATNVNVTWATAPVSGTNNLSLNVFLKP